MQEFYNKALIGFLCLLLLSAFTGYFCVTHANLSMPIVPVGKSDLLWRSSAVVDATWEKFSTIKINDDQFSLNFDFIISKQAKIPNASVDLVFVNKSGETQLVDLSRYNSISFSAKCAPANTLAILFLTYDKNISTLGNMLTYRAPTAFFSCNENWTRVEIDLTRLEVPQWWFDMFKIDLSNRAYKLDKVPKMGIGTTSQSPFEVASSVQLHDITLTGRDWRYIYLLGISMLFIWGGYFFWFYRQHTKVLISELKEKIQKDRPLIAYQQLSVEPHRDKEKTAILRFIATEYANPDLDLESVVSTIGVNRTKVNDILKLELGFTFSTYLNKLRLTEAARLLSGKEEANVAEIAYSVGYKNASYFNKLFKEEYGCTPKTFKELALNNPPADGTSTQRSS